jgi:type IV secretory pathway ATPase VirB11/archaellum biosynthesis ATPase
MVISKKLEKFNVKDVVKDNSQKPISKKHVLEQMNDYSNTDYLLNYDYKIKELKKINVDKKKKSDPKDTKPKDSDPKDTDPKDLDLKDSDLKDLEPKDEDIKEPIRKKFKKNKFKKYKFKKKSPEQIESMIEKLSKKTEDLSKEPGPFIESFSFLEDKPVVKKINFENYDTKNLYSKLDYFIEKHKKSKQDKSKNNESKKSRFLIEEFDIPDIISLKDDVQGINYEDEKFRSEEKISENKAQETPTPIIVSTDNGVSINPSVQENIKRIDDSKKKESLDKNKKTKNDVSININNQNQAKKEELQTITKNKTNKHKDENINYILPSDSDLGMPERDNNFMRNKSNYEGTKNQMYGKEINQLVYTVNIDSKKKDFSEVYEKYSINDFTFVTIYYKDNKLIYNIVQPKLDEVQEKIYKEIKNIFVDSIDKNFFSFNGDEKEINDYMKKIYDITINKLSTPISSLDKKLYFLFIENDFSGLGFLSNVLRDENIIEINCMGAGTPINVYHIKYGIIETNLVFENLSELNIFVIELTKVMGLHINSNNPVIDGYLQNGYKVEGLYSVGDISSKGSSFVVKKFLEKPLTPISLVNLGVGSSDIFTYIWSVISNNYHVVITGNCDTSVLLNAIVLFYPDKEIITIQPHDNLKLPHKKWVKRKASTTSIVQLKTLLDQSIVEKPDYIVVDKFTTEFFESQWYNISLMTTDLKIKSSIVEKIKLIGQKSIVIDLRRVNVGKQEYIQINEINEYVSGKEYNIVKLNEGEESFRINLLSSNINIVDYKKRKNIFNWMLKTNIYEYRDFNNIIDDYYKDSKKLLEKLDIKEEYE